jgi:hypothetical protein
MELKTGRVKDVGRRDATMLSNGETQVVICENGGMVSELSSPRGDGRINAHWTPHFRSYSGIPYASEAHQGFWPVKLLYDLAGNFPCVPSFGPPNDAYGISHAAHGATANGNWTSVDHGVYEDRAVYLKSTLRGEEHQSLPLDYMKYDILVAGQPIHYAILDVANRGSEDLSVSAAWHNTVGPPFLSAGCLIDTCSSEFATAPAPSEFDDTGRLEIGAQFADLRHAPLRDGGTVDLREIPGMIGYTDFATGAVPVDSNLGWSSVTSPLLGMTYMTLFKGPAAAGEGDLGLNFNELWMQYGGRRFPPWAAYEGATDNTFCLGTENATSGYANGLAFSLEHTEVLGRPTTITIPSGQTRRLCYGTALVSYAEGVLDGGVNALEWSEDGLVIMSHGGGSYKLAAATEFADVEGIANGVG